MSKSSAVIHKEKRINAISTRTNVLLLCILAVSALLLGSIPIANPKLARMKEKSGMEGDIPSPIDPPSGCRFHTRCPYAKDICSQQVPQLKDVGNGHMTACHLYG